MSTTPTVVVSVLLATAAAVAVSFLTRPSTEPTPGGDATAALQREVSALQQTQADLQKQLAALASAPAPAAAARPIERVEAPTVSSEQVAAAVEAYLSTRSGGAAPAAAGATPAFDMEKDFAALLSTNYWENPALWKRAQAAGVMDEVLKKYEAMAKQNPNDASKQMQLANAYLAVLQMDPSSGPRLGMKADKTLDAVLELEPTHWNARFSKAMSYTFWPDFLGKKPAAIKNFEMLVEQQDSMPVEAQQAQTYLFLGNLLEQRGDTAKAKAAWARGAKRHPDNEELRKKAGG
jgi:tetratricopeptide (TPR) repeat protein